MQTPERCLTQAPFGSRPTPTVMQMQMQTNAMRNHKQWCHLDKILPHSNDLDAPRNAIPDHHLFTLPAPLAIIERRRCPSFKPRSVSWVEEMFALSYIGISSLGPAQLCQSRLGRSFHNIFPRRVLGRLPRRPHLQDTRHLGCRRGRAALSVVEVGQLRVDNLALLSFRLLLPPPTDEPD